MPATDRAAAEPHRGRPRLLSLGIADAAEQVTPVSKRRLMYARNMAWLADQNSPEFLPATMTAKVLANDIARDVAQVTLKAGGGSGFLRTSPIQRLFRDAQAGGLMAYSAEVSKDRIGKTVLLPQD